MQGNILLFDFDGTIADTADIAVKIYNEIAKENHYTLISKENLAMLRGMGVRDAMRYTRVPFLRLPMLAKRVRSALKSEIPNLKAIEGIQESLQLLKQKGHKLFIISSNSKENIKSFFDHNHIKEFDDIYSVSDLFGKHVKIIQLLRVNEWDKRSVMYIGDEVRDIEAAKKAAISSVAVAWGYNNTEVLAKNNPDVLLKNPSELSSL